MENTVIISNELFKNLIGAASLAASADNMQPWEFKKHNHSIEVFMSNSRKLPTDVSDMFSWVSIGAAIQNIIEKASLEGLATNVKYQESSATITFSDGIDKDSLSPWIDKRTTNRSDYDDKPLDESTLSELSSSVHDMHAGVHWVAGKENLKAITEMDASLSFIRLDHEPFHKELFDIIRLSEEELEEKRFGLSPKVLGMPPEAAPLLQLLKSRAFDENINPLAMANGLASKLQEAGAICIISSKNSNPAGYMEAGRAMEKLWLFATSKGLSLHPYGALPQYLTKFEKEPHTFPEKYHEILREQKSKFYTLFSELKEEYPAILLRVGKPKDQTPKNDIRIGLKKIIRE